MMKLAVMNWLNAISGKDLRMKKFFFSSLIIMAFKCLYDLLTLCFVLLVYGEKKKDFNINLLRDRIRQELDGPANSAGYRSVWHTLKLEGIQVPRETVRVLVSELDPEGVRERRAKALRRTYRSPGPNYVWHVDGYEN